MKQQGIRLEAPAAQLRTACRPLPSPLQGQPKLRAGILWINRQSQGVLQLQDSGQILRRTILSQGHDAMATTLQTGGKMTEPPRKILMNQQKLHSRRHQPIRCRSSSYDDMQKFLFWRSPPGLIRRPILSWNPEAPFSSVPEPCS